MHPRRVDDRMMKPAHQSAPVRGNGEPALQQLGRRPAPVWVLVVADAALSLWGIQAAFFLSLSVAIAVLLGCAVVASAGIGLLMGSGQWCWIGHLAVGTFVLLVGIPLTTTTTSPLGRATAFVPLVWAIAVVCLSLSRPIRSWATRSRAAEGVI